MGSSIFLMFDESELVDGLEFETIKQKSIHTEDSATLIEELGCENLQLIGMVGEDRLPIYGYVGEDRNTFISATGYDIGSETFQQKTDVSSEEYKMGIENASATHLEIIGPKIDLECNVPMVSNDQTFKPMG